MRGQPQDWTDPEVIEGAVLDLAKPARKRFEELKKRGVVGKHGNKRPGEEDIPPPEDISSQTALAYLTADPEENPQLAQAVRAIRQHYWETEEPPFPWLDMGQEAALTDAWKWLKAKQQEDKSRPEEQQTTTWEVRIRLRGRSGLGYLENFTPLLPGPAVPLSELAAIVNREQMKVLGQDIVEIEEELKIVHPSLKKVRSVHLKEGGLLTALWSDAKTLAEASGWWSQQDSLLYLMIGRVPSPQHSYSFSFTAEVPVLKLEFQGPVRESEVLDLYRRATEERKAKARRLSSTQAALLQLRSQTPHLTWLRRLAIWERWLARYPELRDFAKTAAPQQEMRKEWERGREKANWQFAWKDKKGRLKGGPVSPPDLVYDPDLVV